MNTKKAGDWNKVGASVRYLYTADQLRAYGQACIDTLIRELQINIKCETQDFETGISGVTFLPVVRVEVEDDGSFTAVTPYWPNDAAPELYEALFNLVECDMTTSELWEAARAALSKAIGKGVL